MPTPVHSRLRLLINFVAFEIGWFAAVLGAAHDFVWTGVLIAMLVVMLHLWMSQRPLRELQLLLLVLLLGASWDSALIAHDVIRYFSGQLASSVAPVWIMAVWALFATTLNVALVFLRGRYLLAAVFGAIGAPLSFLGGMRLQALSLPDLWSSLCVLALGWAVLMPILMYLSVRFDGVTITPVSAA